MINELSRKITTQDMRAGQGPALLSRLGINLKPVNDLFCTCGHAQGCTCRLAKPTRDAKPKYGIGHPALIGAVLALRNISDRMDRVEQIHAANQAGMAQGGQAPQDITQAAQQRADTHLAQMRAEKIDSTILEHHQKKADEAYRMAHGDPRDPGHAHPQQRPDIDNEAHRYGPLDPASGDGRQKTTQHPLGQSRVSNDGEFITPEQARQLFKQRDAEQAARHAAFMREAAQNKAFNQNQRELIRSMKSQIDGAMKERWK
jgi:hypothetical protein